MVRGDEKTTIKWKCGDDKCPHEFHETQLSVDDIIQAICQIRDWSQMQADIYEKMQNVPFDETFIAFQLAMAYVVKYRLPLLFPGGHDEFITHVDAMWKKLAEQERLAQGATQAPAKA